MLSVTTFVLVLCGYVYKVSAQYGYISLNARSLSDTQVLVSRHDIGNVELASLDFAVRRDGETRWRTTRFNPTREYFAYEYLNSSTLYYFRLLGRQLRTYHIYHAYTHIRTPPYTQRPPANVTAVTQKDGNVRVTWLPEPDGRVLGYLVIYTEVDSKDRSLTEFRVKPVFRTTETTLTDVKTKSRYKVEVASISLDGEGASKQSTFVGDEKASYVRIVTPPRDVKVHDEGTVILFCEAEGFPTPKIVWRKSGRRFSQRKRRFLEDSEKGMSILRIDPVIARQDKGTYTCTATNGAGQIAKARAGLTVYTRKGRVAGYPSITHHPVLKYVEEGSEIVMNCTSNGTGDITTQWYRDSFPVYHSKDNRITVGPNAQLTISKVRKEDEGTYECSAENAVGVSFSYPAHLYVKERIQRTMAPVFLRNRLDYKVTSGGNVRLPCDAVGQPVPEVYWEKEGIRQKGKSRNGQNILKVRDVRESAEYTCVAHSSLDTIRRVYTITVIKSEENPKPPVIKQAVLSRNVSFRSSINLDCEAEGDPVPLVIWTASDGQVVKRKSRHGKNTLRLYYLRRSVNYTCVATNYEGEDSQEFMIKVAPRGLDYDPSITDVTASTIDSSTIQVSWRLIQHPRARVYRGVDIEYREMTDEGEVVDTQIQRYYGRGSSMHLMGLHSGTTYMIRVLARTAREDYVPSELITSATDPEFPEPPSNLRTTRVSHSEIDIKWDTRTPLERLSGFSVFVLDVAKGREMTIRIRSAERSSYTIPDLTQDKEYEIGVSSWIRGDEGNRSIQLPVRTKHFTPDPPPDVKGDSINSTALWVSWALPEDRYARSYIIGHHIIYEVPTQKTGSKIVSVVGTRTREVVTSLNDNTTYQVQVRAYTAHAEGKLSAPLFIKTMVSPQPVNLVPNLISHNSIHLTWEAPVIIRNITGFNVYVRELVRKRLTKTRILPEKEYTVTGLQPETRYVVRVSSNYKSKESDLSEPLEFRTLPYIPPPPTNIVATPVNETAVLVEWTTVKDALVTGYLVTWHEMYQRGREGQNRRVTGGSILLSPVVEDSNYKIRVRTETDRRKGMYSEPLIVTTLESDKPVGLRTADIQFNKASLSWYAPLKKRGITGFELVLTDSRMRTVIREDLPAVRQYDMVGLSPDTLYTVTVRSKMGLRNGKKSDELRFKTSPFVPDAPSNIVARPVDDSAVQVTWTPTLTTETKQYVVRYHVAYNMIGGSVSESVQVTADSNEAVITGLKADTSYRLHVRAETQTEKGVYSEPTRVKTMESDKPTKLKTTQVQYNQVEVAWSAPISVRNIVGFHLVLSDLTTREITRYTTPPTSRYHIRELEPDRKYTLTVKSLLQNAEGKTSDVFEFKTRPYIPEAPVDIVASPLHDTAIMVKWRPTVTDENRRYVVRYHIAYNERGVKGSDSAGSVDVGGDTNTAVITSLTADTSYRILVRAETMTEEGEYSQPRVAKTLKSDKPKNLKTTRMKFNEAVVSWYAPIRVRNITGFGLALTDVTTRRVTRQKIPVTSRHALTGLEPDRMYKLTVTSILGNQDGKTSDVLEFKTLPYVPIPPKNIVTTTLNDTAVQVEWTPTTNDDTRRYVVRYQIAYSQQGSDGDSDEDRSIHVAGNAAMGVITSLDADTAYAVRVRAETLTEKGEYSREKVFRTFVSDRPQALRTTDIEYNQADISWYAPVRDRNITGFQLEVTDLTTREVTRQFLPATLGYSLKRLEPDRMYKVHVTSLLMDGVGKRSNVLEFKSAPFIPKAPATVVATGIHDTAINIQWTPTVDDVDRKYIVRYNIAYNEQGGNVINEQSVQVGKDDVTVDIKSLVADTEYTVRVRAETQTEEGEYSQPVVVKTLVSDKPRSLKTTRLQFNQADVSWYAPVRERDITGFQLMLSDVTTGDSTRQISPPVSRYTFRGLKPDRSYTLTVKSVLADFDGKTSDVLQFRTLPYIPEAPSDVVILPLHDTALSVEWTPTVDDETRAYVVRYHIAYNELNVDDVQSIDVAADKHMAVIDNLVADTRYRVRVRAETMTEEGQYSETQIVKTLVTDKPQSLRTPGVEFNEVEVAWYAPLNLRNITGFLLDITDKTTGETRQMKIQPLSRYMVSGLKPDRKYAITVTSLIGNTTGKTSDVLVFQTLPFVPEAPADVTVTPINDTALKIGWTPTVNDETREYIVSYDIIYSEQGSNQDQQIRVEGSADSVVIRSLVADTSYGVRVRAVTKTELGQYCSTVFAKTLQSDKPRGLKTFGIQFDQADLSWFAPIAQRGITGFLLTLTDLLTNDVSRISIPANARYTLTRLTAEHNYTVTLTALFGDREGKTSEEIQFQTLPFVPEAPEDVLATPINDTAILLEWTPPVNEYTQVYVVRYHIAFNKLGTSQRVRDRDSVQVEGDASMTVIRGLEADTSYRVRVRADTRTLSGALSKVVVVRTLESDKPSGLKTLSTEFDFAEISWYAPTVQRNITNFVLILRDQETGEITRHTGSGKTRQTVLGLKADRKYTLTVTSMLGDLEGKTSDELEFKTKPFVPPVVEEVIVKPLNQSTILVQWKNPDDPGSREYITQYRVEYGEIDRYRRVRDPATLVYTGKEGLGYITGLVEDTDYRIRIRAETDTQTGQYTRAYTTRTLISEQPRQLKATDVHYSSITVSWTAPIEQRNITSFNVFTFDTIEGEEYRTEIPPKHTFRIDNLKPDRVYGIRVSAMMGMEEGQSSNTIEIKTNPYIPSAPTDVKSHPVNASAVHVEWTAPDDLFAREYVIGFNILYDNARSKLPVEKWGLLEYYGGKQNSLITSLEPDTEYNVMVRVNTKTQKGELSRQISVKTMVSAEPTNLRTTRITFDQFELTWDAPVKERNISGFAVYLTDTTVNGRTREEVPPIKKHVLEELEPSTVYMAEVASILDSGEGIVSAPITVETMPFVPDAPTDVQATSYNFSSITLSWELAKDPASLKYIKGCHILYTEMIEDAQTQQEILLDQVETSVLSTLEQDTTYKIQIRAFSDTADGKLSRPIIITTPPKVPDWSPDLLTATVEYDTTVRLEWYVQSPKAQLDKTLKYEVQYYRQPDPYGDMYVRDLVAGPTIIDNLETHSTYSFRIRAYSFSGPGPWSTSLEATLDGPNLGRVRISRVNRTDPYSSKVRWVQAGASRTIKGYRVYYTPVDWKFQPMPGQRYINSVGVRSRLDQMRSLRPEQYYHVQVAAFSDDGIGRRSDATFLPDMDYPRIAVGPKSKKVAAKLAVTFPCQISGVPDYDVYWKKGDVRIMRRHVRFEFKMVNSTSILRIKQARPKDTAEYTCVLNVNDTLYTSSAKLEVYDQTEIPSGYPSFTRNPSLTSVETGSNTSFICAASGVPVPIINWYKNNVPIQESTKFVITQIGRESRLWVLNATLDDVGKYVCSAENRHGTIYNFDAHLYVKLKKTPPVFIETPEYTFVEPGSEVNLTCVVEGEPQPAVRWLVNGVYMDIPEIVSGRGDLVLPEVHVSARYTCEVTNSEGQKSASATVEVNSASSFGGVILREPRSKNVKYGSSVSFHCSGAGNPKPNIYWERNGKRLSRKDFGKSYYMEEKGGMSVLEIGKAVGNRDQGTFSCTVENRVGYTETPATLTVVRKNDIHENFPEITKHPVITKVGKGEATSFFCSTSDPMAEITWYKDRFIISSSKRVKITNNEGASELRILKADEKDYGKYHCSVESQHGIAYSKRAMLYIRRVLRQGR